MSYYHREGCRLCESNKLGSVLSITPTPPANAFVTADELEIKQTCYPLELWFCRDCAHLQLLDVVEPEELFANYVYVSGTSPVFVRHFKDYASSVIAYAALEKKDLVVELGSNDGTLLGFFQDHGCNVLGVDPARSIAEEATASGIETINAFFDSRIAGDIVAAHGHANVVTANNVFAHIDDLDEVVHGVNRLLSQTGVFVFEVSYLLDLYENKYFDMIYHEHLDYHSVLPLQKYFDSHSMQIIRVERIETHGGSIRCYVQKKQGTRVIEKSVEEICELERKTGLNREDTFLSFGRDIEKLGKNLVEKIRSLKDAGKKVAGFGAPAKATTLMYHFGITAEDIEFIVDDSPLKQGMYSPGLHIPVVSSTEISKSQPDYLVILAWNFADSIIGKNREFIERGGKFIVPLPELRMV